MNPNEIAKELQKLGGKAQAGLSPSGKLYRFIERKIDRLNRYKEQPNATEAGIAMMSRDIEDLTEIYDEVEKYYPHNILLEVSRILKRNMAIGGIDLTVLVIPNTYPVADYPYAKIAYEDLSGQYVDVLSLFDAHQTGHACVEVDDISGGDVNDVLKLYNNRGAIYTDNL